MATIPRDTLPYAALGAIVRRVLLGRARRRPAPRGVVRRIACGLFGPALVLVPSLWLAPPPLWRQPREARLDAFLAASATFTPDTARKPGGMPDPQQRRALPDYLGRVP